MYIEILMEQKKSSNKCWKFEDHANCHVILKKSRVDGRGSIKQWKYH